MHAKNAVRAAITATAATSLLLLALPATASADTIASTARCISTHAGTSADGDDWPWDGPNVIAEDWPWDQP